MTVIDLSSPPGVVGCDDMISLDSHAKAMITQWNAALDLAIEIVDDAFSWRLKPPHDAEEIKRKLRGRKQ